MALRGLDHPLEHAAARLLDVGLAGELGASVAEPQRQCVADPLELGDAENTRPADRADPPVEPAPWKGRGE